MSLLVEAGKMLGTPQGSLVYYLLLLWAIVAGLGMALGEWRRARREQAQRLLLATGGLALARIVYATGAAIAATGWASQVALLPPLERFADTVSLGLLAWALMPPAKRNTRAWDLVHGANLVLAIGACVGLTILWSEALVANSALDYNNFWQSTFWSAWQIGLIAVAIFAVLRNQGEGWGTFLAAFGLMLAGQVLQLTLPAPVLHLPAWERLANLLAYPLIAVAVYQNIVAGLRVHSRQLQDISQASMDQIKSLLFLFEASQQMSGSLDLSAVLDNAALGIARALGADQCAIAFPEEGNLAQMRLVAIYNPTRQGRGEAVAFPFEYQLTVQQAMRRKRPVIAEESDNVQFKVLFALMGSSEVGPLLVQPLVDNGDALGAIIVGNSRSRRPFTPNEAKLCQSMAEQLVGAIQNARRYQAVQNDVQRLDKALAEERRLLQQAKAQVQQLTDRLTSAQSDLEALKRREETAREARNALEIKLVSSRAETESLSERVAVLESDLNQAHANSEAQQRWHEEEFARRETGWEAAVQLAEWNQAVLQSMTAGILLADAEGLILETNVAAEILLDRSREELQGLELTEISDDDRWQQAIDSASGGEAVRLTTQIGPNTLMCDVTPLPDLEEGQGAVKGLIAILQDISTEIADQRTHLETVASMAEELRTPITTIISYADLLLSEAVGALGEAQHKFVLRIKAGGERLVQMTHDLNRVAGGEERWASPQRQKVDINKIVEATVAGSSVQLEDRSLTLDLTLPEGLPPIEADPDYLRRILTSLLSNACLASRVGGHIEVQATRSGSGPYSGDHLDLNGDGFLIFTIRDSGGGLSDEALNRVFDRGRPSQTPPGLGESGAGLALVKTLVEAHGGRLWVESETGVGTTFSFVLPVNNRGNGPTLDTFAELFAEREGSPADGH